MGIGNGYVGLAVLSSALALAALAAGWRRLRRSGGVDGHALVSAAVLLVPLAALGLTRSLGLGAGHAGVPSTVGEWVVGPWFPIQAATALASAAGLATFRSPLLALPLAASLWSATQDAAAILLAAAPTQGQRAVVSALTGLAFLAVGVALDRRTRQDLAGSIDLAGLVAFCGGLLTVTDAGDLTLVVVALLHLGLVAASLLLDRRVFAVAGALGLAAALGHLADDLLVTEALGFALVGIGLAVVGLGVLYHRHYHGLRRRLTALVPTGARRFLPPGTVGPSGEWPDGYNG
jgi:hypothetical protein